MSLWSSLATKVALLTLAIFYAPSSSAACSNERIKKMNRDGRTVAAIARVCKMDREEVQEVLSEDEEDEGGDTSDAKLPSGASVGQCGCWGPVSPGFRQPHPRCRSGSARPAMCSAMCPAGGMMWRGVCT